MGRDLYRDLITLAFTQNGLAQRCFAADDLNEVSPAHQLHAASFRAEKKLQLLIVCINQANQRTDLYALIGVIGARMELAPMGHRMADGFCAPSLAGRKVSGFESQRVVFVLGDVFLVGRRLMSHSHCLFNFQQVLG